MAHTNTFSTIIPLDNSQLGKGAEEIRNAKRDIKERLELDHYMDGQFDTSVAGADGHHRKATLVNQSTDPAAITGAGILYAKSDGLYFRNSAGIVKII